MNERTVACVQNDSTSLASSAGTTGAASSDCQAMCPAASTASAGRWYGSGVACAFAITVSVRRYSNVSLPCSVGPAPRPSSEVVCSTESPVASKRNRETSETKEKKAIKCVPKNAGKAVSEGGCFG